MISVSKVLLGIVVSMSVLVQGAWAKVSDGEELFRQVDNIDTAIKTCEFKAAPLEEIKNKALGTSVISGVATVASTVGVVASAKAIVNGKKDLSKYNEHNVEEGEADKSGYDTSKTKFREAVDGKVKAQRTNRIVSTVANGIATGANTASFVMSLTSWNDLGKLMDGADDCVRALDNMNLTLPERASTSRY